MFRKINISKISLIILPLFITAYSQQVADGIYPKALPDLHKHSAIVASVGDIDISAAEFLLNYEFGPAFLKRSADSKKRYLNLIIYEKLMALEGYKRGLADSSNVQRSLAEIEADLVTEELYKAEVMNNVSVNDEEIKRSLQLERQHIHVKWLFTKETDEITDLYGKLQNGVSFDSLFNLQFGESINIDDRSMETTKYSLSLKNSLLASIIDTLAPGNITHPVKAPDGWYLIKLENIWWNPLTTKSEDYRQKQSIRKSIYKLKLEKASDEYVHTIMIEQDPIINRAVFKRVCAYLGKQTLRPEKYAEWDFNDKAGQADPDKSRQKLVSYKSGAITVNEFSDWYSIRKSHIKFNNSSLNSFSKTVEQAIWRMLRDRLLIERAYAKGLQHKDIVKKSKKWWEEKIIYSALKESIAAGIEINDAQLLEYYKENQHEFCNSKNKPIPFDKAKENVTSALYRQKYMDKMFRRILQLKKKYAVTINEDALQKIKVSDEDAPGAIDVYTVKNNGIIPRQPYPTIDWEWQAWY